MSARKQIKKVLFKLSPTLGTKCTLFWQALVASKRDKMNPVRRAKYLFLGFCPGFGGRFNYFGTTVYFPTGSAIFRLACKNGTYEPEVTQFLCGAAQRNTTIFDVGANIGLMTIPVLHNISGSRVVSFEPSPNSADYLERTRINSRFAERWEIVRKGASECPGTVRFFAANPAYGGWDGFNNPGTDGYARPIEIPTTTLDAEWKRLGCPKVSCVKIDVEGAEVKVLKGAEELIKGSQPRILVEWSREFLDRQGVGAGFILDFARSHGYSLATLRDPKAIETAQELELVMSENEMFCLSPELKRVSTNSEASLMRA